MPNFQFQLYLETRFNPEVLQWIYMASTKWFLCRELSERVVNPYINTWVCLSTVSNSLRIKSHFTNEKIKSFMSESRSLRWNRLCRNSTKSSPYTALNKRMIYLSSTKISYSFKQSLNPVSVSSSALFVFLILTSAKSVKQL